jgi:hypothetical protein
VHDVPIIMGQLVGRCRRDEEGLNMVLGWEARPQLRCDT